MAARDTAPDADWLAVCRRAGAGAREAIEAAGDRSVTTGRGAGGDTTLAIDQAAEDAVLAELEGLGLGLTVISEERGEIDLAGGGPTHVVIDPIDGSRNARRGLPAYALSIAVGSGRAMSDVHFAFVLDLFSDEEFSARRGEGARVGQEALPTLGGIEQIRLLGLESAGPAQLARAAGGLEATGADRVRALGSVALSLCAVAAGRLDAMVCLSPTRSVDCAAGQLIVAEAGGCVSFGRAEPDPSLGLDMRTPLAAAAAPALCEPLIAISPEP